MQLSLNTTILGLYITIEDNSKIGFQGFLGFFLSSLSLISSTISSINASIDTILIINATVGFDFVYDSLINSSYIAISSQERLSFEGKIISEKTLCWPEDTNKIKKRFFTFIFSNTSNFSIDIERSYDLWSGNNNRPITYQNYTSFFTDILYNNFTLLIISADDTTLNENSLLKASSIGLFTFNLDVYDGASINATGMGCAPFSGIGKGTKIFNAQYECGGNGGNYGGFQGYGLGDDMDKSQLCKDFASDFSNKYGDPLYPKYQGSGGGGHGGGYGGGVIMINIVKEFLLAGNGSIQSDGQGLLKEKCSHVNGSGAGSGGSIQIYCWFINGEGMISANGGDAFDYCGEGGGGRILIFFNNWEYDWNSQSLVSWKGSIIARSGRRIINNNGSNGNSSFFGTNGSK